MAATTLGRKLNEVSRRDVTAAWRHVDVALIVCTLAIAALGTLMVYSATRGRFGTEYLRREAIFMGVGVVAMVAMTLFDYRSLKQWAWPIYGVSILLLVGVLSPLGVEVKGAQAWFGVGVLQFQPAEFAKLALVIALAAVLSGYEGDVDLRRLGVLLVLGAVPLGLILLQPDLGMVLIFVAIIMGMLLVGGVKARYIVLLTAVGVAGVFGVLNSNVLKQYQKDRLTTFLDDGRENGAAAAADGTTGLATTPAGQGATYNVDQSLNAIGAGGVNGQGIFEGKQTQLGFVPEQETDFIFTVVGEELGFVGGATLLGLFAVVLWRIWRTATIARDAFGSLLCVGVLSFLMFQIFENVGMTMRIMPVTGITLPLVSYGGSSIIATFIALGLVLNVHMRRFRV